MDGVDGAIDRLGGGLFGATGVGSNLALSPFSAAVALGMTLHGSRGETFTQLRAVFDGAPVADVDAGLAALRDAVVRAADVEIVAADGLFGQAGGEWAPAFLDALARSSGAGMQTVDFVGDAPGAVAAVNRWTAERTGGRIRDLVDGDVVTSDTRLILVNALYLRARWANPFLEPGTTTGRFRLAGGRSSKVAMMRSAVVATRHGVGDGWAAATLPYAGHDVAMTVILPDVGRLHDVETAVAAGGVAPYLGAMRPAAVDLTMPRFTVRTATSLKPALRGLGVVDVFDPGAADLGAMTSDTSAPGLHVTDVLQQVYVAVDEHGTEAAAATAVIAAPRGLMPSPQILVLDRPFLFVIHDVAHGTPLFLGRVSDPTA